MPWGPWAGETGSAVDRYERTLSKLAIADNQYYEAILGSEGANREESRLDAKTHALVRLGALIATGALSPGFMWSVEAARRSGASNDEIVGCLIAAVPALGVVRVVSAAPELALALGFDVSAALEESGPLTPVEP
jgi:4-carboxymuconolactone decarboxylase